MKELDLTTADEDHSQNPLAARLSQRYSRRLEDGKDHKKGFKCFYNNDLCCGWYRPRPCLVKLIIILNFLQTLSWSMYLLFYLVTPQKDQKGASLYIFKFFNPFIKSKDDTFVGLNPKIIKNMIIISIPQFLSLLVMTYYGFEAWR
jgi:hypothetical protein